MHGYDYNTFTLLIFFNYYNYSDSDDQVWVWEYETEDGKSDMFMDDGEEIRFKVMEEMFVDISPSAGEHNKLLYIY